MIEGQNIYRIETSIAIAKSKFGVPDTGQGKSSSLATQSFASHRNSGSGARHNDLSPVLHLILETFFELHERWVARRRLEDSGDYYLLDIGPGKPDLSTCIAKVPGPGQIK